MLNCSIIFDSSSLMSAMPDVADQAIEPEERSSSISR